MCLMKPNYDVVNHTEYLVKTIIKLIEQLTEWTDLNTDIMTDGAYLYLMDIYKQLYEIHNDPGFIANQVRRFDIEGLCKNIENILEFLELLDKRLKCVDKGDEDYKPIGWDDELEELVFYYDNEDTEYEVIEFHC